MKIDGIQLKEIYYPNHLPVMLSNSLVMNVQLVLERPPVCGTRHFCGDTTEEVVGAEDTAHCQGCLSALTGQLCPVVNYHCN